MNRQICFLAVVVLYFLTCVTAQATVQYAVTDLAGGGSPQEHYDINASGEVVCDAFNRAGHALFYSASKMIDLGTLGGTNSYACGINDNGQVVGYTINTGGTSHAWLYSSGMMTDLGTLGGTNSYAYSINASGQVVGCYYTPNDASYHAFLYSGSTMTDLGALGGTNSTNTIANAINASGQVVGVSAGHAFLYSGSAMTDLNTLIDPLSGWTLKYAFAINDTGQIVGCGSNGGRPDVFLLTPVPEPSMLVLLCSALLGFGSMGLVRRRM